MFATVRRTQRRTELVPFRAVLPPPVLLLFDLTGFAENVLENHTYVGAFLVLVTCGFGMPLPEEVTLIGSGILLYKGVVDYWWILAACWLGVLCGDAIPYTVGRLWGMRAFEHRWVRRIMNPRRLEKLEERFRRHLAWGVFSCRFFPGLRWPGYFIAGHLRMPIWKWLLLDAIGASILVPFALHLGLLFGANTDMLASKVKDFQLVLAFVAFAILATVVVRSRINRARARADAEEASIAALAVERAQALHEGSASAGATSPGPDLGDPRI